MVVDGVTCGVAVAGVVGGVVAVVAIDDGGGDGGGIDDVNCVDDAVMYGVVGVVVGGYVGVDVCTGDSVGVIVGWL